jgi:hypothetical protein
MNCFLYSDEILQDSGSSRRRGEFWRPLASSYRLSRLPSQKMMEKNGEDNKPVEASTMRRMTVITPNKKIAPAKTERVGHLLINGAIRMAPTH